MIIPPPPAANIDFETYSEAGFVWDAALNKWTALPGASQGKKGLPVVGSSVYVEHPTFEALCLSYDLRDGAGVRRWKPGEEDPAALFAHIQRGGLVSGWNSGGFEVKVWAWCVRNLAWPPVAPAQWRDAMANARAHALPGALAKAAEVLNCAQQKNKDGKRLLDKFSIPRNPTKANATLRIRPTDDPADAELLYAYCDQDVATEQDVGTRVPELTASELAVWQCDRVINDRGVQMDVSGVENCIAIINQAHARYNAELAALTDGTVQKASELQKLIGWLGAQGVHTSSLDEEHLDDLLADQTLPWQARRALEIRAAIGSASVKKVFAMHNQVSADGRLRDLFVYHGARTGRVTGGGPQPTNLPNSAGVFAYECESCERHFGTHLTYCPWCGCSLTLAHKREWGIESAEYALETIASRDYAFVEYVWGDAMLAVSGCLRALFTAAPGRDLLCSDYSSIEAVVVAELAGEDWRRELFRTHGKVYEMSASKVVGISLEDILRHKTETGSHHSSRKLGKVMELACFSPDTQVLTSRGYVRIVDVLASDELWDGVEWTQHDGLIEKGVRSVINLDGVRVTPTHLINSNGSWLEAKRLVSDASTLSLALETGSANLPLRKSNLANTVGYERYGRAALVEGNPTKSTAVTCSTGNLPGVRPARRLPPLVPALKRLGRSFISVMRRRSQTPNTAGGSSIGYPPQWAGAITRRPNNTTLTADAGYTFATNGAATSPPFSFTWSHLRGGTTRALRWTGKKITEGTSRAIFVSSRNKRTTAIVAQSEKCNSELTSLSLVYDIANAGPRNRFTIKTNSGHLIVHNCGYQGWIGSMLAFGADAFMTELEMKDAILAWRAASPMIVEFWGGQQRNWRPEYYGVEGMAVQAILNPGAAFEYRGHQFQMRGDALYLRLVSGRELTYHRPRLAASEKRAGTYSISYEGWNSNPKNGPIGWIRMDTWGGRLVENIVQATARDIQWYGVMNLERAGYPVVLHVYDEDIAEVPEGFGSIEEFEYIMAMMPPWAADWPIKAKGGWRGKRYRK